MGICGPTYTFPFSSSTFFQWSQYLILEVINSSMDGLCGDVRQAPLFSFKFLFTLQMKHNSVLTFVFCAGKTNLVDYNKVII
jgi:hypothetical protein